MTTITNNVNETNGGTSVDINGLTINQTNITDNGFYLVSSSSSAASFVKGFHSLSTTGSPIDVSGGDIPNEGFVLATTSTTTAEWKQINANQINFVKAASTSSMVIANIIPTSTLDGITLADNDRILLKDQSNAIDNGIYTVSPLGAIRSSDMSNLTVINGNVIIVNQGTTYSSTAFYITNGTVSVNQLIFNQFGNKIMTNTLNAITSIISKHIILMNGTYNLTSPLTLSSNCFIEGSGNTILTGNDISVSSGNYTFKNIEIQNDIIAATIGNIIFNNVKYTGATITITNSNIQILNSLITNSIINLSTDSYCYCYCSHFIENVSNLLSGSFIINTSSNVNNTINNCFFTSIGALSIIDIDNGSCNISNCHINNSSGLPDFLGNGKFQCSNLNIVSNGITTINDDWVFNDCIFNISSNIFVNGNNCSFNSSKFLGNGIIVVANFADRPNFYNCTAFKGIIRRFLSVNNNNIATNEFMKINDNNLVRTETQLISGLEVSFTNGATGVSNLTGGQFLTDFSVGDIIEGHTIQSITNNTLLALTTPYSGSTADIAPIDLNTNRKINCYENVIDFINNGTGTTIFRLPALGIQAGHRILCRRDSTTTVDFSIESDFVNTSASSNILTGGSWSSVLFTSSNSWAIFEWTGLSSGTNAGWYLFNYSSVSVS